LTEIDVTQTEIVAASEIELCRKGAPKQAEAGKAVDGLR
jgi:hypothetical protein